MGKFDSQIATAQRLIKENGQLVSWKQQSVAIADDTKPWNSSRANEVSYPVYIVFLSPRSNGLLNVFQLLKGTDITTGGNRGLMGAVTGFTPQITDKVIRDGVTYAINSIDVLAPNGQTILYKIEFTN